jgi:hypothetical protein
MGILSAIPTWIKALVVVAVVAAVGIVIYQWRADIQTAAYDAIFKKTVDAALKQNQEAMQRLIDEQTEKSNSLQQQLNEQKQITDDLTKLKDAFAQQKFNNVPIDPGLKFTFDQIRAAEAARAAAQPKPAAPAGTAPNPTLDSWKAKQK